ncbi:MAG: hypothetical protein Q4A81_01740 [Pasteurellaceae bacterium]|nr:hypothetical protein [Pasteurellaceae bacterium]
MKISLLLLVTLLLGCSVTAQHNSIVLGGSTDSHGCLSAAGQSYSFLKKECVQVFNVADIKLVDPDHSTQAVYVILSTDKKQAEIFASDLPENTVLTQVKSGYLSKDEKIQLIKIKNKWIIKK